MILTSQQSQSQFNAKGGSSLAESRSFLGGGEQKPLDGNISNVDGKACGPAAVVSTFSSNHDSLAPEIRLGDAAAALTKAWNPANFQNSQILPSHSSLPQQMQFRGQFGIKNDSNIADQVHSEPGRSMPLVNLPQNSNIRPGMVNLRGAAQPLFFMARDARQNLPLQYSASISSNTMVPPLNYGYLAQSPGMQSSLPILNNLNMPFQVQPPPRGPIPGTTQALHTGQNIRQVAPNAPEISVLLTSLMAHGILPPNKQVLVCSYCCVLFLHLYLFDVVFFVNSFLLCTESGFSQNGVRSRQS